MRLTIAKILAVAGKADEWGVQTRLRPFADQGRAARIFWIIDME